MQLRMINFKKRFPAIKGSGKRRTYEFEELRLTYANIYDYDDLRKLVLSLWKQIEQGGNTSGTCKYGYVVCDVNKAIEIIDIAVCYLPEFHRAEKMKWTFGQAMYMVELHLDTGIAMPDYSLRKYDIKRECKEMGKNKKY
jgi:hypothetical protein